MKVSRPNIARPAQRRGAGDARGARGTRRGAHAGRFPLAGSASATNGPGACAGSSPTRSTRGALPVAPEPSEVAALVEQPRTAFLSVGAGHDVRIDLPPVLPRVMAGRRRIVQVLGNLLANAARHSPEGFSIRVAAARHGAHVAVSVADRGEGLAPEGLAQLFRRHAGVREGGGSGLGLVICKGLVEAHGGRIRAESAGWAGAPA